MKKIKSLSDKELAQITLKIAREKAARVNRKSAALAILSVLKKHKLSVSDLIDLDLGQNITLHIKKKKPTKVTQPDTAKKTPIKKPDKRAIVHYKYKNPKGAEQWSGRGRAPKWVTDILTRKGVSISQFKADRRYKI